MPGISHSKENKMAAALFAALFTLFACGHAGNFTVTEEVWFDVEIKDYEGPGEHYKGRFVVAVMGDAAPMTALNFVSLARGHKKGKETLTYKKSPIHRIVPDFVVQMGDITVGDGSGGKSIYGDRFADEDFILSHRSDGWVSMANHGPDSNNSQFFILLTKARWLDGKHIVFGKVVRGWDVIDTISNSGYEAGTAKPSHKITVTDCGVNEVRNKYQLTEEQLTSTEDI